MIVSGNEYLALPRAPETWVIEPILPVGGSMLIYGDAKIGKSYAALQLACCLVSGVDWLGFSVPQATSVVYIQLDTPRSLWATRVQALKDSGHPVEAVHFADRDTLDTHPFDILEPTHFAKLVQALRSITDHDDDGRDVGVEPGVVIIDTLREAHSGDENDSTEMQDVIAHLDAAVKPAAMVLVNHSRKSSPDQGYDLMNDNRGSNYVVGRMDGICRFAPRSMRLTSRSIEEHSIELERAEDGTWEPRVDILRDAAEILVREGGRSIREMARLLHSQFPNKSESACRAIVRRVKGTSQKS